MYSWKAGGSLSFCFLALWEGCAGSIEWARSSLPTGAQFLQMRNTATGKLELVHVWVRLWCHSLFSPPALWDTTMQVLRPVHFTCLKQLKSYFPSLKDWNPGDFSLGCIVPLRLVPRYLLLKAQCACSDWGSLRSFKNSAIQLKLLKHICSIIFSSSLLLAEQVTYSLIY